MAPAKQNAKEPAKSAPEADTPQITASVSEGPETPIVIEAPKPVEAPKPKFFRVRLLKNYRPDDIEGSDFVIYDLDEGEDDPEDFMAKRTERKPNSEERAKTRAGAVIGLQAEEARRALKLKIAERFDVPNL